MGREGAYPKVIGIFTDLLHRRDTAGLTLQGGDVGVDKKNGKGPGSLSGKGSAEAHRETGPTREEWGVVIPITGGSNEGGGIVQMRTSILRRQNTVAQFIATRPILDLCKKAKRRPGAWVPRRWWEQTGVDWRGAMERVEAAAKAAEPGTKALTDPESKADDDTTDRTVRGTG